MRRHCETKLPSVFDGIEPAIYAKVLDGLCVAIDKVLFVGDTPRADIEGPRAAGMKAIHVDELVAVMFPD